MSWAIVFFFLPLVFFALVLGRLRRVVQRFQDPEQLQALLSSEVRTALERANVDVGSLRLDQLQQSEELRRIVAPELRRILQAVLLGRDVAQFPSFDSAGIRTQMPSVMPGSSARGQPVLPPPIDSSTSGGAGAAIAVVLAMVGLGIAIFLLGR